MREVCLIGFLPQDPDGAARLLGTFEDIQPGAIAVEADASVLRLGTPEQSLAAIAERLTDAAALEFWRQRLAPEHVHYPAFTSADYGARLGIDVHFLGDPAAAAAGDDASAFEQLDAASLRDMAAFDWRAVYAQDYARARRDLEAKGCVEFLVPLDEHLGFYQRDRALARQLDQLPATDRLAVVCAIPHLYYSDTRMTLYTQLPQPAVRRFLSDGHGEIRDLAIAHPL